MLMEGRRFASKVVLRKLQCATCPQGRCVHPHPEFNGCRNTHRTCTIYKPEKPQFSNSSINPERYCVADLGKSIAAKNG